MAGAATTNHDVMATCWRWWSHNTEGAWVTDTMECCISPDWQPLQFYERENVNFIETTVCLFSLVAKPNQNKYFHLIHKRETHIRTRGRFITPSQAMCQDPLSEIGLADPSLRPSEPTRSSDAPALLLPLGWLSSPPRGQSFVQNPSSLAWVQETTQLCQSLCPHSGPRTQLPSCKLRSLWSCSQGQLPWNFPCRLLCYRPCGWGIFRRNWGGSDLRHCSGA